jgi:hypothetical protein
LTFAPSRNRVNCAHSVSLKRTAQCELYESAIDSDPDDLERAFLFYDLAERHPCAHAKAAAFLRCASALVAASERHQPEYERFGLHDAVAAVLIRSTKTTITFSQERLAMHTRACAALYLKSLTLLPSEGRRPRNVFQPEFVRHLLVGDPDPHFFPALPPVDSGNLARSTFIARVRPPRKLFWRSGWTLTVHSRTSPHSRRSGSTASAET